MSFNVSFDQRNRFDQGNPRAFVEKLPAGEKEQFYGRVWKIWSEETRQTTTSSTFGQDFFRNNPRDPIVQKAISQFSRYVTVRSLKDQIFANEKLQAKQLFDRELQSKDRNKIYGRVYKVWAAKPGNATQDQKFGEHFFENYFRGTGQIVEREIIVNAISDYLHTSSLRTKPKGSPQPPKVNVTPQELLEADRKKEGKKGNNARRDIDIDNSARFFATLPVNKEGEFYGRVWKVWSEKTRQTTTSSTFGKDFFEKNLGDPIVLKAINQFSRHATVRSLKDQIVANERSKAKQLFDRELQPKDRNKICGEVYKIWVAKPSNRTQDPKFGEHFFENYFRGAADSLFLDERVVMINAISKYLNTSSLRTKPKGYQQSERSNLTIQELIDADFDAVRSKVREALNAERRRQQEEAERTQQYAEDFFTDFFGFDTYSLFGSDDSFSFTGPGFSYTYGANPSRSGFSSAHGTHPSRQEESRSYRTNPSGSGFSSTYNTYPSQSEPEHYFSRSRPRQPAPEPVRQSAPEDRTGRSIHSDEAYKALGKNRSDSNRMILGVGLSANEQEIKEAYQRLVLKYHPDKNKASHAADVFKLVNEAYKIVTNPTLSRNFY